jgi:hypothetical protein
MIGPGRSYGDRVSCEFSDTCCQRQEIPDPPTRRWYLYLYLDVTFVAPTPTIPVSVLETNGRNDISKVYVGCAWWEFHTVAWQYCVCIPCVDIVIWVVDNGECRRCGVVRKG